jgi:Family of unknown function (DUF5681)
VSAADSSASTAASGPPAHWWRPGQSGNPAGRKRDDVEVRLIARKFTREAIQTLATIMRDKRQAGRARVDAAEALLNRGWGRPEQAIALTGDAGAALAAISIALHLEGAPPPAETPKELPPPRYLRVHPRGIPPPEVTNGEPQGANGNPPIAGDEDGATR